MWQRILKKTKRVAFRIFSSIRTVTVKIFSLTIKFQVRLKSVKLNQRVYQRVKKKA
jgi:hypothetical protein